MEEKDIQNLEAVFTLARQASVNNKQTLKDLLVYEDDLLSRLKKLIEPKKETDD